MLVKVLGAIDVAAALAFLMLTFGMSPIMQFTLFCAALLFLKGLFVLIGNVLSLLDLISAILLILSLFMPLPAILLWLPALLLLAKGVVSFL